MLYIITNIIKKIILIIIKIGKVHKIKINHLVLETVILIVLKIIFKIKKIKKNLK